MGKTSAAFAIGSWLWLISVGMAQAAPRLHCEAPTHDFGTMETGETVRHAFVIVNRGESDLAIERVRTCCGAAAAVDDKTVGPGGETRLRVTMPLRAAAKNTTKTFYLHTNDPANRIVPFRLTGTIEGRDFGIGRAEYPVVGEHVGRRAVVVEFFFEAGCPECETVEREVLPGLATRLPGVVELRRFDIGTMTNYLRLAAYQKRFGIESNESVSMVVDGRRMLDGLRAIRAGLVPAVEAVLAEQSDPAGEILPDDFDVGTAMENLRERAAAFTVWAVVVAGLTDGINPCAISALVFFMSLLAMFKIGGRILILTGVSFCLASFLTYTAIGFGLLRTLHAVRGFAGIREGIEIFMTVLLAVFALLSFWDAWRFARSGKAGDVSLKLPAGLQRRVHAVMRSGLATRRPVLAGFGIGAAVTILESVCTGQVYLPTLVLIARDDPGRVRVWSLLLLYNAMFVLPLAVVFVLTWFGLRTETLMAWSRRHVVFGKVLLGLFFVAMAVILQVL